ncbi:AMP-binding protein [Fulvivirga ulvae]|uniref:phenylacetate--CoA ligase family protein n=1 Tax=Fulvivirga ulvae TaxID=2904245 RepID=UPI001F219464|nr:AMP-binding protein [Fulvivirga ulvae]UII34803.1 AMP-binding protein [Fulvivirga ulvae]
MSIPPLESRGKEEITNHQLKELKKLLLHVSKNSPFYKRHFEKYNIDIESINSIEALRNIPPTDKSHLQAYQRDFWCVEPAEIVEYCNTSGTEGAAVTIPLTDGDLRRLSYNEAISLACTGGDKNEIYQLTTTLDRQFMAGLAYALGARELGAGMIRVGPGLPQLQWKTILEVKPTALIVVPSFLIKLIEYAEAEGIDFRNSSVKKAICIGEPIRKNDLFFNALGEKITSKWDIELYSTYASTEMAAAFTECSAGKGGHLHPELLIAEILDDRNQPVPAGTVGELTVTTLGVEAMPLLRFKTGDMCALLEESCSCGRNTSRVSPVVGRKNQLIKYKGTTCYPPAIFDLLDNDTGISYYQVLASADQYGNDVLTIRYSASINYERRGLADKFKALLRVTPELVEMPESKILELIYTRTSRKPVKFIDNRR